MIPTERDEIKPIRPSYWSIQFIRDIFTRQLASELGSLGVDAVALLCMVAAEQDRERAKDGGPARLFVVKINEQLGWNDPHKFGRVLRLVVESGWLQAARPLSISKLGYNNRAKTSFWPKYPEESAIDWPDGLVSIPAPQRSNNSTTNTATTRSIDSANTARIAAPQNSIDPSNAAPQRSTVTYYHKPTTTTGAAADLVELGIHPPTAQTIVATHPPDDITDRLIEYKAAIRSGKKIGPGALVSRFRDGAWPAEGIRTAAEIRAAAAAKAKAAAEQNAAENRKKDTEAKAAQEAAMLEEKFGTKFDAMPKDEQDAIAEAALGDAIEIWRNPKRRALAALQRPDILRYMAAAATSPPTAPADPKLRGTRHMQDHDRTADFAGAAR